MQDIVGFYSEYPDHERLANGVGLLEFERTKEILLRSLPPGRRVILDIGGGTGLYAEWLAQLGYDSHLIDITPGHIEVARSKRNGVSSAEIGDARDLAWPDASADVILLLGPLYHLVDAADRLLALAEARRVLRPGGLLFAPGSAGLPRCSLPYGKVILTTRYFGTCWPATSAMASTATPPAIRSVSRRRIFIALRNWLRKSRKPVLSSWIWRR
jgi:ubiquinone/menaquinone biosynthesis C-methylase UbiE